MSSTEQTPENEGNNPDVQRASTPTAERRILRDELSRKGKAHDEIEKKLVALDGQKQRESFFKKMFKPFGIFGLFAAKLVSPLTKLWAKKGTIPDKEFTEALDKSSKEISGILWAHRGKGGKGKENTPEAVESIINAGEKQIEVDFRIGDDGNVYCVHDTIAGVENPAEKYPTMEEILETFANNRHQDVAIYFDLKDVGILEKLDTAITEIDEKNKGRQGYEPLKDRHFIGSFNHEVIAKAKERDPNRPTILTYIPSAELKSVSALLPVLGHKKLGSVAREIDKLAGTSLESEMDNLQIHVNGKAVKGHEPNAQNIVNVYNLLPPDNVLKNVDFIAVPTPLATSKLIKRAHSKGVKVGLWGGGVREIQQAMALGADMIVSDNPNYLRSTAVNANKMPSGPAPVSNGARQQDKAA